MKTRVIFAVFVLIAMHSVQAQQVNRDSVQLRIVALKDSLQKDPNSIGLSIALARCYIALDSLKEAENTLYHVQTIDMHDPRVYIGLGELYEKQGEKDMAIAQYQLALRRDPHSTEASKHLDKLNAIPKIQDVKSDEPSPDEFIDVTKEPKEIVPIEQLLHYPEAAKRNGLEGKVMVNALIDYDGKVIKVNVVKSDYDIFKQPAYDAMIKETFTPALRDQTPLKVWITRTIQFRLK